MYDDRRGAEHTAMASVLAAREDGRARPVTSSWALPSMIESMTRGELSDGGRFAHQADVVATAMVGHTVATDWSHALKSGYDVAAGRWPAGLARTGLSEQILPAVVSPGSVLGTVCASWAAQTGLPHGVPVYAGMTDGCAAQIGAGTVTPGDVHTVIGTTMVVKSVSAGEVEDAVSGLYSHRSPDGLWYPGAASHAGAAPLTRFRDLDDLLDRARRRYADRPGNILTAYPSALEGERFPFVSDEAGGSIWGPDGRRARLDDAEVDPVDRVASILLGLACVERLALERLSGAVDVTGTLSTSGGASSNPWLTRIRAEMLDRAIHVRPGSEAAMGMAVLACWSEDGSSTSLADITDRMVPAGATFEPPADRTWADDAYERFLRRLRKQSWI
jgi:sugar (pentulose or hexulose) kinase